MTTKGKGFLFLMFACAGAGALMIFSPRTQPAPAAAPQLTAAQAAELAPPKVDAQKAPAPVQVQLEPPDDGGQIDVVEDGSGS
jgi:hypothetical protein